MESLHEKYPELEYCEERDCPRCLCFSSHVVDFLQMAGEHEEAVMECDECHARWLVRQ